MRPAAWRWPASGAAREALREARLAASNRPSTARTPCEGPSVAEDRALILAQAGDADAALDEIERLLAGPS